MAGKTTLMRILATLTRATEGWVAIGAYPWNWAPIVTQGEEEGYFLGVSAHGLVGFKVKVGNELLK